MKFSKIVLSIMAFSLLSLFSTYAASTAGDMVVEGVGRGSNEGEAIMAAKRNAVEKGIGMVLISQTEVENFMVKRDLVISKTIGSVKSFEVISKTTASDGIIEVRINATISKSMMSNDLAGFQILLESMDKPKVMVIINENNIGNEEPTNMAAENAAITMLKNPYQFEVVDPSMVKTIRSSREKMAKISGDAAAAAAIGTSVGAQVIISGTAVSRVAENLSYNLGGMKSVQADVTLRAINCTTGRVIASGTGHGAKVHISPNTAGSNAIATASKKALKGLINRIIEDWSGQINNGVPLMVSVKGVSTFRIKKTAVATLKQLPGVVTVNERGWNSTSGLLEVDIQYKGNADGFCSKADSYKLSAGGSFAVTGQNGTRIKLAIQAK